MDICFASGRHIYVSAETLAHCFSHLFPEDIKSTRQVCKTFNQCSSRYLIKTVIVGRQSKTLQRFEEISKHTQFQNHVTTVVYSTCPIAHNYLTIEDYYESLLDLYRSADLPVPPKEECISLWSKHKKLFEDQDRFQRHAEEKTRIIDALKRMPNIRHLILSRDRWRLRTHPLNADWFQGDNFFMASKCDPVDGPFSISDGFEVMAAAFVECGIRLESLVDNLPEKLLLNNFSQELVDGGHYIDIFLEAKHDNLMLPCFVGISRELFRPLRTLRLNFSESNIASHGEAEECFILIEDLNHLALQIDPNLGSGREAFLTKTFTKTWPNIRTVQLTMDLDYELFSAFCQRNKGSIRHLSLKHASVLGGTWAQLAESIRGCLRLTSSYLEHLTESSTPGQAWELGHRLPEAEQYLVLGGDNPFISGVLKLKAYDGIQNQMAVIPQNVS